LQLRSDIRPIIKTAGKKIDLNSSSATLETLFMIPEASFNSDQAGVVYLFNVIGRLAGEKNEAFVTEVLDVLRSWENSKEL
jgi:hypothetical protein